MSTDLDPFENADAAAGPETSPDWIFARAAARNNQRVLLSSRRRLGEHVARMYPDKEEMDAGGLEALLEGYLPKEPLINEDTNVIALGSCFAALFVQWLAEKGFNRQFAAAPDASFVWSRLETPVVVAQQFRWAFGDFDPDLAFWFGPGQQPYEATEARREQLRSLLVESDVAILTLGLTESWYDVESGEAIWRVPPPEVASDRYRFKVGSVAESVAALETIERLRREHMPSTKFILTTSPVRFGATFRPISPVVANVASKAGVRASLDEFLRAHEDLLGGVYHYFPSYEMVTELFMDPFRDNRHPYRHVSDAIIALFARHYTTMPAELLTTELSPQNELHAANEELRRANEQLEKVNRERLDVIQELKTAADERLGVIEQLDAEVNRLRALPPSRDG
jgi:GSCFA family